MDVDMDNEVETPMATGEESARPSRTIDPTMESLANFAENLGLYDDHDVDFRCQGWSIKAHKRVIRAKSPVLTEMLQSQKLPEDATWVHAIEDMDHDCLWLFVRFLYKNRLVEVPTFDRAIDLYESAYIYQVEGLARACAPFLVQGLTAENAWDILNMAYTYDDEEFGSEVWPFIRANGLAADREQWRYYKSTDRYRRCYEAMLANGEAVRLMERMRSRGFIIDEKAFPPPPVCLEDVNSSP